MFYLNHIILDGLIITGKAINNTLGFRIVGCNFIYSWQKSLNSSELLLILSQGQGSSNKTTTFYWKLFQIFLYWWFIDIIIVVVPDLQFILISYLSEGFWLSELKMLFVKCSTGWLLLCFSLNPYWCLWRTLFAFINPIICLEIIFF